MRARAVIITTGRGRIHQRIIIPHGEGGSARVREGACFGPARGGWAAGRVRVGGSGPGCGAGGAGVIGEGGGRGGFGTPWGPPGAGGPPRVTWETLYPSVPVEGRTSIAARIYGLTQRVPPNVSRPRCGRIVPGRAQLAHDRQLGVSGRTVYGRSSSDPGSPRHASR